MRRQGTTLIELIVVIVLLGIVAVGSGGLMSQQMAVVQYRSAAKGLGAGLTRAQFFARLSPPGRRYGVVIFPPETGTGPSFLAFSAGDPWKDIPAIPVPIAASGLAEPHRSVLQRLPLGALLMRDSAGQAPLGFTRITFLPGGALDLANSDEENLRAEPAVVNDSRTGSCTLDITAPGAGRTRLRIHFNGTIEETTE